MTLLKMNYLIM